MIDELINRVKQGFDRIEDHRMPGGNLRYALSDVLMSAYAMFSLKDPSLLVFRQRLEERWENLKRIYQVKAVPADTALRQTLDGVSPSVLQAQFQDILKLVEEKGLWSDRMVLGNHLAISIDGTGYYCSSNQACEHCLVKTRSTGKENYHHQMLAAVQVHHGQATVFPWDAEPIQKQDGQSKNDCEQNAAKRLIPRLGRSLAAGAKILTLMDALYPSGPCLKLLKEHQCSFIITIKEGYVLIQAEKMAQNGELKTYSWEEGQTLCKVWWAENLIHSGAHQDLTVNYFHFEQVDSKTGKTLYSNSWITNLPLSEDIMPELVATARSRWKVENETFNTLKNQGYNLEHNYGHGEKYLVSNFAILMMLAFLVDQIAQHADQYFQKAWNYCKTKKNLWEKVRQVFDLLPCMSMNVIYRFISKDVILDFPMLE
ncbi:MAG: transposase [Saprospiraceae bacterium]|nr:transposase [Saprospiraceae bacterium]